MNENGTESTTSSRKGPTGFTGETDRVSGEYHYKNGYTQQIYTDAHYVREEETTEPPRYYEPKQSSPKPKKEKTPREKKGGGAARAALVVLLCMVFLLAGCGAGAWYVYRDMNQRVTELETFARSEQARVEELEARAQEALQAEAAAEEAAEAEPEPEDRSPIEGMSAAEIYQMACEEVVGITTDVTYTNYFGRTSSSAVSGSGFFVTADGYILTNYHVIQYAYEYGYAVTVMTHGGERYDAKIIGVEEGNDIAILKIDAEGVAYVRAGDSGELSVGDDVYAVGNPLGELVFSMTFGRVSALNRLITTDDSADAINMFQFDAAVNSGNSGGPLYNSFGEVVGVVTAKYSDTGVEGLGFAIPINDAVSIADELITKGYVSGKATLGVTIDERYNSVYSRYYGMPEGAYISSISAGSCAEAAGLRTGDIILSLGDFSVSSWSELRSALKHFSAGDTTELSFYRSGERHTVTVVLDEDRPALSGARGT